MPNWATKEEINSVSPMITSDMSLMGYAGKAEIEVIVAQTIMACAHRIRHNEDGIYSVKDDNVEVDAPMRGVENGSAYNRLLSEGMLEEETLPGGEVAIHPTSKLIRSLVVHFERKQQRR